MTDDNETTATAGSMRIDSALVRDLAELLNASGLTEIEVEDGDRRIRVARQVMAAAAPPMHVAASAAPIAASVTGDEAATPTPPASNGHTVRAPMVGTAYLSAEPGAPPFAVEGKTVNIGDTLLIVEAMKVMNPIVSDKAGVVRSILVDNAQPVEFDQPLVIID